MGFKLDLEHDDFDQLDRVRLTPDWYCATVTKVWDHEKDGDQMYEFAIAGGPFDGAKISWKVGNPETAQSEAKANSAIARLKAIGKRLGYIFKDDKGRPAQRDPQTCVGTKCVIQTELRTWIKDDGGEGSTTQLTYLGVYNLDHPEIPAAVRVRLGLPLLPGQSIDTPTTTGKKEAAGRATTGKAAEAAAAAVPSSADLAAGL